MLDRKQPEGLRPVESKRGSLRTQLTSTSLGISVEPVTTATDLAPADLHTWEDFWSNLLDEYEHIRQEVAEAA